MKYIIDENKKQPAYLQLYMQVRDDIIKGIYPHNSKLPSKRIISSDTGVSTVTVEHAYALLCDEGYIEPRERSGYFVIFSTDAGFVSPSSKNLSFPGYPHSRTSTIDFPFSVLSKTMRSVISNLGESILERSPNPGCIELREAIRLYLAQSRGIIADIDQIIIGSGSEYLYTLLIALFGRNHIFAIESPSYKQIEQVYTAAEIKPEKLPLGNDGIESEALRNSKADILHISPYRSYPSGVTATASKRHEYLTWAETNNRYIIEDDFESEFSVSKKLVETLFSHSHNDNVIYMNTFSMTISPSLRIGYMVLDGATLLGNVDMWMDIMGAYEPDALAADFCAAYEYATEPAQEITMELPRKFRKWVETLEPTKSSFLRELLLDDATYLNFNYTEFLETMYSVPSSKITYIHGCRKNKKQELILGHAPGAGDEDDWTPSIPYPNYKSEFKMELLSGAIEGATRNLTWYDEETTKKTDEIIANHHTFFASLSHIENIIVISHSLSNVDYPYFKEILKNTNNNANWIISWFSSRDLENINTFSQEMGIQKSKISIFK